MIRLKSLEIEGFRSFKNKTVIDFPDNGMVLLTGKYDNSDISSGSGKSSILMAIAFALDVSDLPATELKNWDSSKLYVKLTITKNSDIIEIIKNPKLSLIINGIAYDSLTVGIKEKLQNVLETTPELLKSLTYRPQRSEGKFINMTDSEMKDFLSGVLGLSKIETALEQIEADLKYKEIELIKTDSEISAILQVLNNNALSDFELDQAKADYENCLKQIQILQSSSLQEELEFKINQIQNKILESNHLHRKVSANSTETKSIRNQILILNDEIKKLEDEICPTCSREWNQSFDLLDQKKRLLQNLIQKMEVNINFEKNAAPIINNIENLEKTKNELQQKLGSVTRPINDALNAKNLAEKNLKSITTIVSNLKFNKNKIDMLNNQKNILEKEIKVKTIQKNLLGRNGFLGVIFDEVLKEIESRTNEMIKYIPNILEFSISLSSITTSKNGNIKKAISKKVYKDGKETTTKALSGGQQCGLELCADLAVAETIRSRHGSQLNWIALDEAMDGLGVTEKQFAIDMIKTKVNGLILIIDHATEVKESFEKVIEIKYNGRESYVSNSA